MARAYASDILQDQAGNVIQGATVTFYTDEAASTLISDGFNARTGGSATTTAVTDSTGRWKVWLTTPKSIWPKYSDTSDTAHYPGESSVLSWTPFVGDECQAFQSPADEVADDASYTAVRYAAPTGNDSNGGLSWADAKATILAAYDALPASGGVVRFAHQTVCQTEVAGGGIWLAGSTEPQYAALPAGWRQLKPISFIGEQTVSVGQHVFGQCSEIVSSSSTSALMPAMWITGSTPGMSVNFENLYSSANRLLINRQVDGVGVNDGAFAVRGRNFSFAVIGSGVDTYRPAVEVDGEGVIQGSFWLDFDMWSPKGNPSGTTFANRLAVDIKSAYAMRFGRLLTTYGGMRITTPINTTWDFNIDHIESESMVSTDPTLDIVFGNGSGAGRIGHASMFDSSGTAAAVVRIDGRFSANQISVGTVVATAPATEMIAGPCNRFANSHGDNDNKIGQVGPYGGYLHGPLDGKGWLAPFAVVRATNQCDEVPGNWQAASGNYGVSSSSATVTSGRTGPYGGTGAGKVDYAGASAIAVREFCRADLTLAVGDHIVAGVWMKVITGAPYPGIALDTAGFAVTNQIGGTGGQFVSLISGGGDGWEWRSIVLKVTTIGTNPCRVLHYTHMESGESADFYYPTLIHLPAASYTEAEAHYIGNALAGYANALGNSVVALPRDVTLNTGPRVVGDGTSGNGIPATDVLDELYQASGTIRRRMSMAGVNAWDEVMRTASATGDTYEIQNGNVAWVRLDDFNDQIVFRPGGNTILTIDSTNTSALMAAFYTFITAATTSTRAGLRLPHGTAPTSPVDGDVWTTTSGLFFRYNGITVGPIQKGATLTQTYSTADATLGAYTSDPESSAYTGAADGEAKLTDLNALRVAYENLRVLTEDLAAFTNSLVDALQAMALVG